ncbi:MAG: ATP phosphoribosyltransferase regulatory subunit [Gammaproteobacteria bacterium]|nr:ATP phosphoribosyltransferase regulatory subunit [Gammaproteobacteria bacterium]
MVTNERWLLPQGIEESLPAEAAKLEGLRRKLLDMYASWGYQLVMPPFIEYLESLLTGTGHDLDLQTFKLIDQLNGRSLGVRADMTPQVARIDAHQFDKDIPNRLCYIGTVLHTRPDGFGGSRSPLQVGAEIYGHAGVESDVEVLCLMLETFNTAGVENVFVDIGHVGIFRGLARQAELDKDAEARLFEMLQRKAIPEIEQFLAESAIKEDVKQMLRALADLHGDTSVLTKAEQVFSKADTSVKDALSYLVSTADKLQQRMDNVRLHFDLAELRGYHYQTGIVFAAFVAGHGQEIARGGRYDDIGKVFGRARPATGFSTDLKSLVDLSTSIHQINSSSVIYAPLSDDNSLRMAVTELRAKGKKVIEALPGQTTGAAEMNCDQILVQRDGQWLVEKA